MEHKKSEDLQEIAHVTKPHELTRDERLERWALALENCGRPRLRTLSETEHRPTDERLAMRADQSVISVAFEDPILRLAGMRNDTYGEALRFFELTDHQLHEMLCDCHFGSSIAAQHAAWSVRRAKSHKSLDVVMSSVAVGAIALTGLAAFLL